MSGLTVARQSGADPCVILSMKLAMFNARMSGGDEIVRCLRNLVRKRSTSGVIWEPFSFELLNYSLEGTGVATSTRIPFGSRKYETA